MSYLEKRTLLVQYKNYLAYLKEHLELNKNNENKNVKKLVLRKYDKDCK